MPHRRELSNSLDWVKAANYIALHATAEPPQQQCRHLARMGDARWLMHDSKVCAQAQPPVLVQCSKFKLGNNLDIASIMHA